METVYNVINLCALFDIGVDATCASNAMHKVPNVKTASPIWQLGHIRKGADVFPEPLYGLSDTAPLTCLVLSVHKTQQPISVDFLFLNSCNLAARCKSMAPVLQLASNLSKTRFLTQPGTQTDAPGVTCAIDVQKDATRDAPCVNVDLKIQCPR